MLEKSITVEQKTGICPMIPQKIIVRNENGLVVLFINRLRVEMNTTLAHDVGKALVTKADWCLPSEHIELKINSEAIGLLPRYATQIGAGLLRKADDADDFQLANPKRRVLQ